MTQKAQNRKQAKRRTSRGGNSPQPLAPSTTAPTGTGTIPVPAKPDDQFNTNFANDNPDRFLAGRTLGDQRSAGGGGFDQFLRDGFFNNVLAGFDAARAGNKSLNFDSYVDGLNLPEEEKAQYRLYWGEQNPEALLSAMLSNQHQWTGSGGTNWDDYLTQQFPLMKAKGYNQRVENQPDATWRAYLGEGDLAAEAAYGYEHRPSSQRPLNPFVGQAHFSLFD